MKGAAVYYRWPGMWTLLRIADHSKRMTKKNIGLGTVVANLTFCGNPHDAPGMMSINDPKFLACVSGAMGRYFLRSMEYEQDAYTTDLRVRLTALRSLDE